MGGGRRLVSSDEATPATCQHTKPCSDCPFARGALNGWLGGSSKDEWLQIALSEQPSECHVHTGVQCAGLAIFRANICKLPRDRSLLVLPRDTQRVFASPAEFLAHHGAEPIREP